MEMFSKFNFHVASIFMLSKSNCHVASESFLCYQNFVSIILIFVLLIAPIFIYAFLMGLTWDDNSPLPDWLMWFIILGGVAGTALLVPIHRFIICKVGGYPKHSAKINW